ncbi:MAG: hypothetical protein LQ342_003194 [Letrouitia transgressa]|nr:MAG: hypothetical protein LQ342_003194 [Letrouitia transgressa]
MPSSSSPWNRKSAFCFFVPQGVLAFLVIVLSAAVVILDRSAINGYNDYIESSNFDIEWDFISTGPSQYPYPLSALCIASATFLAFLVSFVLVLKQKASPVGVIISNIFWATGWLGLFAYGIYWYHDHVPSAGDSYINKDVNSADIVQFTFFVLTPFEPYVAFMTQPILALSVIVIAIQAHRRKFRAGGPGLAGPTFNPQTSLVLPHHQPYPQYQQFLPNSSLVPAFELHNQPRPASELPGGPQLFYQNGQWYQYQPVPVSGQSLQPQLASPISTAQLQYPQQSQQTATTQAAPTTELAAKHTKSETES